MPRSRGSNNLVSSLILTPYSVTPPPAILTLRTSHCTRSNHVQQASRSKYSKVSEVLLAPVSDYFVHTFVNRFELGLSNCIWPSSENIDTQPTTLWTSSKTPLAEEAMTTTITITTTIIKVVNRVNRKNLAVVVAASSVVWVIRSTPQQEVEKKARRTRICWIKVRCSCLSIHFFCQFGSFDLLFLRDLMS